MAGAGYKLFNTGDVLTAAQVNTYLMEQTVMVFADATARTTALSGVVAEGMLSYLKSTKQVEVYNGSAWVASDDPNAIQNTIVDAKGDLIAASANDTPARLAVGNNGDTLVADSSTTTGLRWADNYGFTAGKNKFINGDFAINQRSFSSTTTTGGTYGFDRWKMDGGGGTVTYSAQTFTPGTAPVTGYEARNFARMVTSGQSGVNDYAILQQLIESVRTFANQTVTVSFWARAGSGTPKVAVEIEQFFGSGGSPSATVRTTAGQLTLSTSWARYSITFAVPTISGKTLGTTSGTDWIGFNFWTSAGSTFNSRTNSLGVQNATIDFWGVQVEIGSVATAFQTATGTLAGELQAAQRYYLRWTADTAFGYLVTGIASTTTAGEIWAPLPVTMRVKPSSVDFSAFNTLQLNDGQNSSTLTANPTISADSTTNLARILLTTTGLTQFRPYVLRAANSTGAYIGVSAEL